MAVSLLTAKVRSTAPGEGDWTVPAAAIELLLAKLDAVIAGEGGSAASQTPALAVLSSASGTIAAGAKSVSILASADFVGTVLTAVFTAGASVTYNATGINTIGAIAYTRSAGSLLVATLT